MPAKQKRLLMFRSNSDEEIPSVFWPGATVYGVSKNWTQLATFKNFSHREARKSHSQRDGNLKLVLLRLQIGFMLHVGNPLSESITKMAFLNEFFMFFLFCLQT